MENDFLHCSIYEYQGLFIRIWKILKTLLETEKFIDLNVVYSLIIGQLNQLRKFWHIGSHTSTFGSPSKCEATILDLFFPSRNGSNERFEKTQFEKKTIIIIIIKRFTFVWFAASPLFERFKIRINLFFLF